MPVRLSCRVTSCVAWSGSLVFYFSHQWHDTDALIRANEIAVSQLRNVNSGLQVRAITQLAHLHAESQGQAVSDL